jgi:hypothetical protein
MFSKLFGHKTSPGASPSKTPPRPTSDAARAEAKANPGGWIYEIGGGYDPKGTVPPQAIKGAWKVDDRGEITDEYKANSNFDPTVVAAYRAEYLGRDGPTPQNYRWAIWRGETKVAEFGHDFRNDGRWLIINGATKPILEDVDILTGGGPEPTVVSEGGRRFLDKMLSER